MCVYIYVCIYIFLYMCTFIYTLHATTRVVLGVSEQAVSAQNCKFHCDRDDRQANLEVAYFQTNPICFS